jgi:hypothetical protein
MRAQQRLAGRAQRQFCVVSGHPYRASVQISDRYRIEPTPAAEPAGRKPRARKRPKGAPTHVRSWPLRPNAAQYRETRTRFFTGIRVYNAVLDEFLARSRTVKSDPAWEVVCQMPRRTPVERKARAAALAAVEQALGFTANSARSFARSHRAQRHLDRQHRAGSPGCFRPDGTHKPDRCDWQRSRSAEHTKTQVAELHRRLAEHRKTLHGGLANRLFAHGANIACEKLDYVAWQKNFPRSVRDRAPGTLVEMIRRKAESAGGERLYEYNPQTTALSQTCLCGNRKKKLLSQRVHRCECGITEHRDLFSAYLGLHVRTGADGPDRLDLEAANTGWLHRQDIDGCRAPAVASSKRRGRRHPPTRRSVARIKARRAAKRQSRSARTSTTNRPTELLA